MDRKLHQGRMAGPQRRTGLAMAILPAVMALTLAACGGGGGGGGGATLASPADDPGSLSNVDYLASSSLSASTELSSGQRSSQALSIIGATEAHNAGHKGVRRDNGRRVRIAVADSGVYVSHPDLQESFIWQPGQNRLEEYPLGRNFA